MSNDFPFLTERFSDALKLAHELHATQSRKASGTPYIAHLLAVTAIVLEYGGGEDEAIAALLHDAVEDQGGAATLARIRAAFGDAVAAIVEGCSDTMVTPKPPWRARKERYLAQVIDEPLPVLRVSLADKFHNVRSLTGDLHRVGPTLWDNFHGGRDGTLWNHRALAEAYAHALQRPELVTRDDRAVTSLQALLAAYRRALGDLERLVAAQT